MLPKAHTRFFLPWTWTGEEAVLQSRCLDEKGQLQPTEAEYAQYWNPPVASYTARFRVSSGTVIGFSRGRWGRMAKLQMGWRRPTWSSTCTASTRALALAALLLPGTVVFGDRMRILAVWLRGRPPTEAELRDKLIGPDGALISRREAAPPWTGHECLIGEDAGRATVRPVLKGRQSRWWVGRSRPSSNYWPIAHWPFAPSIWDYILRPRVFLDT